MTKEAGTLRWMAPEMIRRLDYDQSVDVYSFGILMFELLTGDLPYKHYTPLQAGFAVCERKVRYGVFTFETFRSPYLCVCFS